MSEKILITGGGGFLGSVMTHHLLSEGHNVTVLDSFIYEQNSLLDCCSYENFNIIRGDVRDKETLQKSMSGQDVIIHLAALVGAPLCDDFPMEATTTNIESTKLILSLRTPNQKIIYPNTDSAYGAGNAGNLCTEETPLNPLSLYGKTKVEAEKLILESDNSICLRLATVFGVSPRMRIDLLVNNFVYRAINDKFIVLFESNFKRNYVHISDVAKAFAHTIKNFDNMNGESYNVGLADANLTKLELCEIIKKHMPDFVYFKSEIDNDPDKRDYIISTEKIEKTGFKSTFTIDMGIKELMKAFSIVKNSRYGNY